MKTTIKYTISLVLTIALMACSSENNDQSAIEKEVNVKLTGYAIDSDEYNITYNEDNKITVLEHGNASPIFTYNDLGKVFKIDSDYANTTVDYTYNRNGKINTMVSTQNRFLNESNAHFSYNNSGQLAKIEFEENNMGRADEVNKGEKLYEYSTNNLLKEIIISHTTGNNTRGIVTKYYKRVLGYDSNTNISKITHFNSNDNGISYNKVYTANLTYDTYKNPLKLIAKHINENDYTLLPIRIWLYFNPVSISYFNYSDTYNNYSALKYQNTNNIISIEYNYLDTTIKANKYYYEHIYNKDGYPTATKTIIDDKVSTGKTITIYRKWHYDNY